MPLRRPATPSLPLPSPARDPADAARQLKDAARLLGFVAAGIAPARLPPEEPARLLAWLAAGRHGHMEWLAQGARERADAASLLPGARSVLVLAIPHSASAPPAPPSTGPRGVVSTYASAHLDYHRVIGVRLQALEPFAEALLPGERARRFCDTAPLMERAFARAAGLGFVGKNTQLIDPKRGSFLFLAGLALTAELPPDAPDPTGDCGTCTRCLEACPTGAFPAPYELDARRCVSYLTIEHEGPWPEELRALAGARVFGCDACQTVCPWNKFAPPPDPELAPEPERAAPALAPLLRRTRESFKSVARHTPWERPGKAGLLRNVAAALGNAPDPAARDELAALASHEDPGVAEHARWALSRLPET